MPRQKEWAFSGRGGYLELGRDRSDEVHRWNDMGRHGKRAIGVIAEDGVGNDSWGEGAPPPWATTGYTIQPAWRRQLGRNGEERFRARGLRWGSLDVNLT